LIKKENIEKIQFKFNNYDDITKTKDVFLLYGVMSIIMKDGKIYTIKITYKEYVVKLFSFNGWETTF